MGFIGSDTYYALCTIALFVLILLLIGCQIKARRRPKKKTHSSSLQHQKTKSLSGMKFQLQYQIEKADGKMIAKEIFSGSENNIVPCLEMMRNYIDSQIELYEKIYEKVLPNLNDELEQLLEELENGKPLPEILKDFIESESQPTKPRYAAGGDMDRINRNARVIDLEDKPPRDPSPLIGALVGFFIFVILVFVVPNL